MINNGEKNNSFLISWSFCLVFVLMISLIGFSTKKTYSADDTCYMTENGEVCIGNDDETKLYGKYKLTLTWDDPYPNGVVTYSANVNFTANGKTYQKIEYVQHISSELYFWPTSYASDRVKVLSKDNTWNDEAEYESGWSEDKMILYFSTPQDADTYDNFYVWFHNNAEPVNECYYNENVNGFVWTNVKVGALKSQYSYASSCNAARAIVFNDSSNVININGYSTPHYYFGTKGESFNINEYYSGIPTANVSRKNYSLSWNTKADGTGTKYNHSTSFNMSDNLILYAIWTPNKYTVSFDSNGGTGSMSGQSFSYGVSQTLNANSFVKDGYSFKYWNTMADGSGITYGNKQSISISNNMTLYAIWEVANDDLVINDYLVDETEKTIFVPIDTTKTEFDGDISVGAGYSYVIDSKTISGKEVLYTGGKIQIINSNGAVHKEYDIVVFGDVNGDGELNTMDYISVYNHLDNSKSLTGLYLKAADMNQDNDITTMDYITIYNALGGN